MNEVKFLSHSFFLISAVLLSFALGFARADSPPCHTRLEIAAATGADVRVVLGDGVTTEAAGAPALFTIAITKDGRETRLPG